MTVKDIVIDALKKMGADGLCNRDARCGCSCDDFPCWGDSIEDCEPARLKIAEQSDIDKESEFEVGDEIYIAIENPGEGK